MSSLRFFLMWRLGIWIQVFVLCSKHFTHWTTQLTHGSIVLYSFFPMWQILVASRNTRLTYRQSVFHSCVDIMGFYFLLYNKNGKWDINWRHYVLLPIRFLFRNDYYLLHFQYHLVIQWDALEMHSSGFFYITGFLSVCIYVYVSVCVCIHTYICACACTNWS